MKSLERRLHLYFYVSARLDTSGKRVTRGYWSGVTDEWNRDHPYDGMTPATLSREWNRNRVDPVVLDNVQIVELAFADEFAKWVNAAPSYDMTVASDPLSPVYWILKWLKSLVTSPDK